MKEITILDQRTRQFLFDSSPHSLDWVATDVNIHQWSDDGHVFGDFELAISNGQKTANLDFYEDRSSYDKIVVLRNALEVLTQGAKVFRAKCEKTGVFADDYEGEFVAPEGHFFAPLDADRGRCVAVYYKFDRGDHFHNSELMMTITAYHVVQLSFEYEDADKIDEAIRRINGAIDSIRDALDDYFELEEKAKADAVSKAVEETGSCFLPDDTYESVGLADPSLQEQVDQANSGPLVSGDEE